MTSPSPRRATEERRSRLVALVGDGASSVEALARELGVSPSTVRRDLTSLQDSGRIARTYGGALLRDTFEERPFDQSARLNQEAKRAIARAALDRVAPRSTVFLDAGTTCLALARLLAERGPLTVVTRGLEAALLLARAPEVTVTVVGGVVQPLSHGLVGPLAGLTFARMTFDHAFLGADAIDPRHGLGEPTLDETHVKEEAAARARQVTVLADASKFADAQLPAWLAMEPGWSLVTDAGVDPAGADALRAAGIEVLVAG